MAGSGGLHASGPSSPFERFSPSARAIRWPTSVRSFAYAAPFGGGPGPCARSPRVRERHGVVDVQGVGRGDLRSGPRVDPVAGGDRAIRWRGERDRYSRLVDEYLGPSVLTVVVGVAPAAPEVVPAVGVLMRRLGDREHGDAARQRGHRRRCGDHRGRRRRRRGVGSGAARRRGWSPRRPPRSRARSRRSRSRTAATMTRGVDVAERRLS